MPSQLLLRAAADAHAAGADLLEKRLAQLKSFGPDVFGPNPDLTEVRDSTIPGAGKGLFALHSIPAHTVVAQLLVPARMKRSDWEKFHVAVGLPHDAAIYMPRSPLVFHDAAWVPGPGIQPPYWYRLNHSRVPTLELGLFDPYKPPQEQRIVWRTIHRVEAGQELTFKYGEVPAEWDA